MTTNEAPKFQVGDKVHKGNGAKVWEVRDIRQDPYTPAGVTRWDYAVKNPETGKSSSLWHGERELRAAE